MYSFSIFVIIATISGNSWAEDVYGCENTVLVLECTDGAEIQIANAYYGNFDRTRCPSSSSSSNVTCQSNNALTIVRNICENETKCTININNSTFEDPCPNTSQYLALNFTCSDNTGKPKKCPKNEHNGTDCACNERCPSRENCTENCVSNQCVCDEGYKRDPYTKECISKEYCPLPGNMNSTHEIFSTCANCQHTCKHPFGPFLCHLFYRCKAGYECTDGYLRDCYTGQCVIPAECPRPYPRW